MSWGTEGCDTARETARADAAESALADIRAQSAECTSKATEAETALDLMRIRANGMESARDSERALADELAEALDLLRRAHFDAGDGTCDDCGEDIPCPTLTLTEPAFAKHRAARS